MNKTYKNTLLGLLAIGMLAGCSSKDVEYDGTTSLEGNIDNKVNHIAGANEHAVNYDSDNINNLKTSSIDYMTADRNQVKSDVNGQTVTLDSIHFGFDKYNLTATMRDVATKNSTSINQVSNAYSNVKIKLEGNCDEWGTDEYNYALGLKRAKVTKDALIADGVSADKIMLVSYGESNPVCTDKNVNCWKMNRRVDYRLLP